MRRRALRHHSLGDPPGHRGLVVAKCQTALCSEVVDPPGEPGVTDSREGENRAELLVRPALLPGHAPPLDTQTAAASPRTARGIRTDASPGSNLRTPPAHACGRAPRNMPPVENTSKHSVVLPIPTVKGQTSGWRDCCPCGRSGPPGRRRAGRGAACSRCVAVRPAVRSGPAIGGTLVWVPRGSARCTGLSGLGETAAPFPAGGGPVREVRPTSRTVRGRVRQGARHDMRAGWRFERMAE